MYLQEITTVPPTTVTENLFIIYVLGVLLSASALASSEEYTAREVFAGCVVWPLLLTVVFCQGLWSLFTHNKRK